MNDDNDEDHNNNCMGGYAFWRGLSTRRAYTFSNPPFWRGLSTRRAYTAERERERKRERERERDREREREVVATQPLAILVG